MIILGIDPGYAITGYGVVEYKGNHFSVLEYGAVTTHKDTEFSLRLEQVYDGVGALIDRFHPGAMAVEKLFFNTNSTTAIGVAEARGCSLLAAQKRLVPIYEYTPLQVKQSITGYGRAEKRQMMEMTRMLLNLEQVPKPDDAADALAVAVCHAHSAGSLLNGVKGRI